jgi:hypothetical protein
MTRRQTCSLQRKPYGITRHSKHTALGAATNKSSHNLSRYGRERADPRCTCLGLPHYEVRLCEVNVFNAQAGKFASPQTT